MKLVKTNAIESCRFPPGLRRYQPRYFHVKHCDLPIAIPDRKVISRQPAQIVSQEQPTRRMLYPSCHLHHILHDLLHGRIGDRHVDGADGDHEVKTRDDVSWETQVSKGSIKVYGEVCRKWISMEV